MTSKLILEYKSFTFETVLSTDRNLELLKRAKDKGYFIRCIYVLTADSNINILRVKSRKQSGGHDVPIDKIVTRYHRALKLIPELINICNVCHIYDNSDKPTRIFKKRKDENYYWESDFWNKSDIQDLVGIRLL